MRRERFDLKKYFIQFFNSVENAAIPVRLLSANACLPVRSTDESAGMDMFAPTSGVVAAGCTTLVPLDISMHIPEGYYGQLSSRSGLALYHNVHVCAGVIDSDYRGNIGVLLINHNDVDYHFSVGDRIAQRTIIFPYAME